MTAQRHIKIVLLALFLAATFSPASAQDYQLGWDEINRSSVNAVKNYTLDWQSVDRQIDRSAAPPPPVAAPSAKVAAQPRIVNVAPPKPEFQSRPTGGYGSAWHQGPNPTFNIEVAAARFYDAYAERYKVVRAVEVATNRGGRLNCQVFENLGECNTYEVFLRDMKPGDSYCATIIWEDGSNRTIRKTIGDFYVEENVFVDEPDALAYSVW